MSAVRARAVVVAAVLASALAAACARDDRAPSDRASSRPAAPHQVVGLARIEAAGRTLTLGHDRGGTVTAIPAPPGSVVAAGDAIVVFEREQEAARQREAAAETARLRAQGRGVAARVRSTQLAVAAAQGRLEQAREVSGTGALSNADLRALELELETRRAELQSVEAERDALTEAAAAAAARRDQAEAALAGRAVRAPVAGTVLQVAATPGQYVDTRRAADLVTFAPAGPRIAVAEIDELFAEQVQLGQRGSVRVMGGGAAAAQGRVSYVAPALSRKSFLADSGGEWQDRRVREVWLTLDKDDPLLLIGTRVEVVIELSEGATAATAP